MLPFATWLCTLLHTAQWEHAAGTHVAVHVVIAVSVCRPHRHRECVHSTIPLRQLIVRGGVINKHISHFNLDIAQLVMCSIVCSVSAAGYTRCVVYSPVQLAQGGLENYKNKASFAKH